MFLFTIHLPNELTPTEITREHQSSWNEKSSKQALRAQMAQRVSRMGRATFDGRLRSAGLTRGIKQTCRIQFTRKKFVSVRPRNWKAAAVSWSFNGATVSACILAWFMACQVRGLISIKAPSDSGRFQPDDVVPGCVTTVGSVAYL